MDVDDLKEKVSDLILTNETLRKQLDEGKKDRASSVSDLDDKQEAGGAEAEEASFGAARDQLVKPAAVSATVALQRVAATQVRENEPSGVAVAVDEMTQIISSGRYTARKPDKLEERELQYERQERIDRKKNIIVRGIRTIGRGIREKIGRIVRNKLNLPIYIYKMRPKNGGMFIELESMSNKVEIMKRKRILGEIGIRIEDDLTDREAEVME